MMDVVFIFGKLSIILTSEVPISSHKMPFSSKIKRNVEFITTHFALTFMSKGITSVGHFSAELFCQFLVTHNDPWMSRKNTNLLNKNICWMGGRLLSCCTSKTPSPHHQTQPLMSIKYDEVKFANAETIGGRLSILVKSE